MTFKSHKEEMLEEMKTYLGASKCRRRSNLRNIRLNHNVIFLWTTDFSWVTLKKKFLKNLEVMLTVVIFAGKSSVFISPIYYIMIFFACLLCRSKSNCAASDENDIPISRNYGKEAILLFELVKVHT